MYENDNEMPGLMETKSIKIHYLNIMVDSLWKVDSMISKMNNNEKSYQDTKRVSTFLDVIPSTHQFVAFSEEAPPAFPIYGENTNGTFPHLVAVTALSTSNCHIWKKKRC